jgi:hypothetical protein
MEWLILEGVADELVAWYAFVDLRYEVLTRAVFEHVLATRVTCCLWAAGGLGCGS